MNGKINNTLLATLKPATAPFEVNDTDLKGFGLRIQTTGVMSYFVRYRLRGKQTRIVIGRTSEFTPAQARDAARSMLAGINLGTSPLDDRKPVQEAKTLGKFITDDFGPWAKSNRKAAESSLARLHRNFDAQWDKPLTDLNALAIEKWRQLRLNHPIRAAKKATVNRDLAALKAAISKAVEWGYLEQHPLSKVRASKEDSAGIVRYLSDAERVALFSALAQRESAKKLERANANAWRCERGYPPLPSLADQAFCDHLQPCIVLSLNTGLRQGELLSLTWADVNLVGKQLTIKGENAKSGKTRHVAINSDAMAALNDWRKQSPASNILVFPGAKGKKIVEIKTAWARLLRDAKIEKFRWHDMRHDFASRLVMAGVDLNTVRELLGHADLKMTLRYAHLAPEHKATAVEKLVNLANRTKQQ
jgi:integrase